MALNFTQVVRDIEQLLTVDLPKIDKAIDFVETKQKEADKSNDVGRTNQEPQDAVTQWEARTDVLEERLDNVYDYTHGDRNLRKYGP